MTETHTETARLLATMTALVEAFEALHGELPAAARTPAELPPMVSLQQSQMRLSDLSPIPRSWAVFWNGTRHVTLRAYLVGLVTDILGENPGVLCTLLYAPGPGWTVAELSPDFCGLLPPDWDLVSFEAVNPCGHQLLPPPA